MAFDGIVTRQVVLELKGTLIGGKVNKVFEPNKNEIILGIYCNGKNYALNISISSNNYRMNLTTNAKPNPLNAPNFCMLLRKHLIGSRITDISSDCLERIVFINFEGYNELNDLVSKKLVVELMGKHSNVILLNDKNIIIDSLRHLDSFSNSCRDILPAHEYVNPPADKLDICKIGLDEFTHLMKNDKLSNILPNSFSGISKTFILNTLDVLKISDNDYSTKDISMLYTYIKDVIKNLGTDKVLAFPINDKDYTVILKKNPEKCISNVQTQDLPLQQTEDLYFSLFTFNLQYNNLQTNFFLDDFYNKKENNEVIINYKNNLLKLVLSALKKITKKVNNINVKLKECESMDTYRIYGELITSNLYRINNNINADYIEVENYYDNNNLIRITLDKSISPSYNAKKYFKKYNKLKNTLEIVSTQKLEATKELDYLESIIYELESATSTSELEEIDLEISENVLFKNTQKNSNVKKNKINKRKVHNEYEPITYNVDGFTLYVGKNNKQNDYITTKLGKNEDLWFHTKDIRGSHCLLKCNGEKVKEHTIIACAEIAAFHSKAKLSSNVPVDYCFIKNVKKPSSSKPGMVIYTNNKTLYVEPKQN
ncbi:MAG: fibronectin/fibrinogen-binding protein [Clostridia bacterium]|nr:fibronectin/fibrinogen-binding protein [Clostridia bacterium]